TCETCALRTPNAKLVGENAKPVRRSSVMCQLIVCVAFAAMHSDAVPETAVHASPRPALQSEAVVQVLPLPTRWSNPDSICRPSPWRGQPAGSVGSAKHSAPAHAGSVVPNVLMTIHSVLRSVTSAWRELSHESVGG